MPGSIGRRATAISRSGDPATHRFPPSSASSRATKNRLAGSPRTSPRCDDRVAANRPRGPPHAGGKDQDRSRRGSCRAGPSRADFHGAEWGTRGGQLARRIGMNPRPGPLNFAPHRGTEFGPETANPPRWNATGRLRHRRYALPCPTPTLRAAIDPSSPRRSDQSAFDAEACRSPSLTPLAFDVGASQRSPA